MKKLKLYGDPDSSEMYPIRDFLKRGVIEYDLFDLNEGPVDLNEHHADLQQAGGAPAIEFPGGQFLRSFYLSAFV